MFNPGEKLCLIRKKNTTMFAAGLAMTMSASSFAAFELILMVISQKIGLTANLKTVEQVLMLQYHLLAVMVEATV